MTVGDTFRRGGCSAVPPAERRAPSRRTLRTSDEAVSNVMGGVLFFTIVFLFFVTIQVDFVPQWTEDDEAALATQAQGQMSQLKGEADRQAANRSASGVGNPITLGERTASKFFQSAGPPGSLSFEPGVANVTLSTKELLILEESGRTTFASNETWTELTGPVTLEDVSDVRHLRMRIIDPESYDDGDAINLTIRDVDDEYAGSIVLYNREFPSGYSITARVVSASGEVIYDQGESAFQQSQPPMWWLDAMAPELHFQDVLLAAEGPVTLEFQQLGMDGAYTITYVQADDDGSVLVGSAGRTVADYERSFEGGRLSVDLPAQHFASQSYHMENGGVVLEQDDGHAMRVPPVFQAKAVGSITKITITTPALTGGSDAVSHRGTINVVTDGQGGNQLVGTAPHLTYAVATAFPDAWIAHFDDTLSGAGLDDASGEYEISQAGGVVTVTVYGKTADPASTDHDLAVDLTHARVHIDFQG